VKEEGVTRGDTYTFGVSEFTTMPWTFEEDIDRYAALGVEAIEVCEIKLDASRVQEQLATAVDRGLRISSVQPAVRTLFPSRSQPEPIAVPERMALFRSTIELCGPHAAGVPFVTNTGVPANGNIEEVLGAAAREYRAVADAAGDHGARVALEPLNPSIMNVETAIWTLQQGMRVVEAVDRANFGICLDYWNIWQNDGVEQAIRDCGDRIFLVQCSDWRTPRSFQDRVIPGDGEIPLASLLQATVDAGYRGPYVVEIFSGDVPDALWAGDLERVITASRAGLDRAWQGVTPREV
jgi:sugar phosphate isomerase/epimerase